MDPSQPLKWGICSAGKISADFVTCMKNISDDEQKVVFVNLKEITLQCNYSYFQQGQCHLCL